jgi:hypothetical protein
MTLAVAVSLQAVSEAVSVISNVPTVVQVKLGAAALALDRLPPFADQA